MEIGLDNVNVVFNNIFSSMYIAFPLSVWNCMLFETKGTKFTLSIKLNSNVDIIYPIVLCRRHLNSNNPCLVVTLIFYR